MDILRALFFTYLLVALPCASFAAVFDVKGEYQMQAALNTAGRNSEADVINILSDMTLAEGLKYISENYPLTINGNGFRINGNEKSRCLDIKENSPCIDVGLTADIVPAADIEAHKRPQGGGVDIGAYEFTPIN